MPPRGAKRKSVRPHRGSQAKKAKAGERHEDFSDEDLIDEDEEEDNEEDEGEEEEEERSSTTLA